MKPAVLTAIVLLILSVSCQKENIVVFSASEVLPSGKWQLKKLLVEIPPGSGASDITSGTFDPCELDDLIEFKSGGSFSCTENTDTCTINTGIFYNLSGGTWGLSGDTLLVIAAGFNVQQYHFGKISTNYVELQQTQGNYLGTTTRYTFVLSR